jgi:hypothetical protein
MKKLRAQKLLLLVIVLLLLVVVLVLLLRLRLGLPSRLFPHSVCLSTPRIHDTCLLYLIILTVCGE